MARVRIYPIVGIALVIGAVAGAMIASPFAIDAFRPREPITSVAPYSRDAYASKFQLEQYLMSLGRDPLAWSCQPDETVRVRYLRNSCFAEHLLEFESPAVASAGRLRLTVRGEAQFQAPDGTMLVGLRYLDASESAELVPLLEQQLPTIRPLSDVWQSPMYQSAIEACISGRSYLAVRSYGGDEKFERLAGEVARSLGVKATRKSPGACM